MRLLRACVVKWGKVGVRALPFTSGQVPMQFTPQQEKRWRKRTHPVQTSPPPRMPFLHDVPSSPGECTPMRKRQNTQPGQAGPDSALRAVAVALRAVAVALRAVAVALRAVAVALRAVAVALRHVAVALRNVAVAVVHELETCSPGGTPGGITDASAGSCQYRQAEEGGGKASAKAGAKAAQ
jgi:hypothetical protein